MKPTSFHPFRSAQARAEYHALYMERAKAWPVESETRLVETPSGQTHVRTSGDPANPPLFLLHGARGNALMWVPNITGLSTRYRTYALDSMNDTGLSVSRQKLTKAEDLVRWLDEVFAILSPDEPFFLAGLSYGGWLACRYALRFPERLRKVVLLTPAVTVLPVSPALILRGLLTLIPGLTFRKKFYYWLLHDTVQSGEAGRAFVDQAIADWMVADRCFAPFPLVAANVLDDKTLQSLRVPTLFLVGEHEKVYSAPKAVERLNRVAPQIETAIIPHAGHDLWMVQADLVTQTILDFLG